MNCSDVFDIIDELNDRYVDVWEDICNIESPSSFKEGVDAVGEYIVKLSEKMGWKCERFPEKKFGDVFCVTMNPNSKKAPIALSGHMDTVHNVGLFGAPAVRREGENIYGPGVTDCKGGIVAGLLAMHALDKCGYCDRPVIMLLQSNEEIGSGIENKGPISTICEKAKNAVAFLNLEGCGQGRIALQRKGIAVFKLYVSGISAHSSLCATAGASAIREAAYKIIELEKIKETDGLTFNCGVIRGGSVRNTVPAECEFELDVRFSSGEELERARSIIQKIADTVYVEGCSCKVETTNLRVAMESCERNIELLRVANSAFEENGLSVLAPVMGSGGSDAADVTAYGIPCLDSLGVAGGRIHSKDEFAVISSLAESAKRIVAILTAV